MGKNHAGNVGDHGETMTKESKELEKQFDTCKPYIDMFWKATQIDFTDPILLWKDEMFQKILEWKLMAEKWNSCMVDLADMTVGNIHDAKKNADIVDKMSLELIRAEAEPRELRGRSEYEYITFLRNALGET